MDRFIGSDQQFRDRMNSALKEFLVDFDKLRCRQITDTIRFVNDQKLVQDTFVSLLLEQIFVEVFGGFGYMSYELTKFSMVMAEVMQTVGPKFGMEAGSCYGLGVISAVGIPILASFSGNRYSACLTHLVGHPVLLEDIEQSVVGTSNIEVLHQISKMYTLPEDMILLLDSSRIKSQERRIFDLCHRLTLSLGYDRGFGTIPPLMREKDYEYLGFTAETLEELLVRIGDVVANLQITFKK